MKESKDLFSRIIIGTVLIVTGALIHYILVFQVHKPRDFFEVIRNVFCILIYGVVANLFILLGLKYYFETGGWFKKFENHVSSSLKKILFLSIVIAVILVIVIFILQIIS